MSKRETTVSQVRDLLRRSVADAATRATLRGVDLTNRLLAFSRKQTLKPEVTDLNARVADVITLLGRTLGEAIHIRTVLAGRLWKTAIDPTQMETALINLALNARDAMPDGGALTIRTANASFDRRDAGRTGGIEPGGYVVLSIADTGCGMTPAVRAQAFDPFFTTKDVGQGSGLGLSMVYGFVKQSDGHVEIDSDPGGGTTVKLYFPRSIADADARPRADAAPCAPKGTGETVLVVEDNPALLRVAQTMLASLGYHVLTAADGQGALALLDGSPQIDLLFTDLVLPRGMNGAVLARQATDRHPDLKVLYTSGYADDAGPHNDNAVRTARLVPKPYRKALLAQHVRQALDGG